jgi:hypothetical protein
VYGRDASRRAKANLMDPPRTRLAAPRA